MSTLCKKILSALIFFLLCFTAEAIKGPILLNVDVPAGNWKAIRLRNLPKDAIVALKVESDGEITVAVVDDSDYRRFPHAYRPLFMGHVEKKLSFSVTIPESSHYYVVFDNRSGRRQRAVTVTAAADRGKTDQVNAANTILRTFEQELHRVFIFDPFNFCVERCDSSKAFNDSAGISLCAGYVQKLYDNIGDRQMAKAALGFSIFHELSRVLLAQWEHPLASQKAVADELATVLMIMLNQKESMVANAENFAQDPLISKRLKEAVRDDRHPLTDKRAREILDWLKDYRLVCKWQKFLVPHMQTYLLKRLQQHPTSWTDLVLVEKELTIRAKKRIRQDFPK